MQRSVSHQLATLVQQMADQEERSATLARRFDAVTASVMALTTRVEALAKFRSAEPILSSHENFAAAEQPTVARRGFFARLFRRGR